MMILLSRRSRRYLTPSFKLLFDDWLGQEDQKFREGTSIQFSATCFQQATDNENRSLLFLQLFRLIGPSDVLHRNYKKKTFIANLTIVEMRRFDPRIELMGICVRLLSVFPSPPTFHSFFSPSISPHFPLQISR